MLELERSWQQTDAPPSTSRNYVHHPHCLGARAKRSVDITMACRKCNCKVGRISIHLRLILVFIIASASVTAHQHQAVTPILQTIMPSQGVASSAIMNRIQPTASRWTFSRSLSPHRAHSENMAFALNTRHQMIHLQNMQSMTRPLVSSHCRPRALFHSCPKAFIKPSSSTAIFSSSQPENNYYATVTQMTSALSTTSGTLPSSPDENSFPKWWPHSNESLQKYIAFTDHIAHVIVPNITDNEENHSDGTAENDEVNETMTTCGDVVQWVLGVERKRFSESQPISNNLDNDNRQLRIEAEWAEGEMVSTHLKVLDPGYRHDPSLLPQDKNITKPNLIASELLALGSVWHLPYSATKSTTIDRFDPSNGVKPTRLNAGDWNKTIQAGDYFRVHFDPRRFLDTNLFDWGTADGDYAETNNKPGVIVARDDEKGYIIINKPPNIPVHARVDNLLENVASSVGRTLWMERRESIISKMEDDSCEDIDEVQLVSNETRTIRRRKNRKQKVEPLVYVATPQRLDQNTSGLLVVASKKSFASYFAKLLRSKTSGQLYRGGSSRSSSCGVHKTYRCLVCISPKNKPGGTVVASVASEIERLKQYTIMKHFLEPSIRAPKRFVASVPDDVDDTKSWAECLLKITSISEVCTVVGNAPSDALAKALWGEYGKPDECVAVAECEIELLTGRTHQIRGQLAAEGFPLVGDAQYGGAVPNTSSLWKERCKGRAESYFDSERLALQCCSLEFLDPEIVTKPDKSDKAKRSTVWSSFRLDSAFWSPWVATYFFKSADLASAEATSVLNEEAALLEQASRVSKPHSNESSAGNIPPRVSLSHGSNKYIVVRAVLPEQSEEQWFVRSASPEECGGPYHANVAESLLHQLQSLGYTTTVMGGGRIDFMENEEVSHAHVFGFSYGFGKGDHEFVASIVEKYTDIVATFDNSDGLY